MGRWREAGDPDHLAGKGRPVVRLGQVLRSTLRSLRPGGARADREIDRAWAGAAGQALLRHTRVKSFSAGLLTIEVDSPPRCQELANFKKEALLRGVREGLPNQSVRDIRFRLGEFGTEGNDRGRGAIRSER